MHAIALSIFKKFRTLRQQPRLVVGRVAKASARGVLSAIKKKKERKKNSGQLM